MSAQDQHNIRIVSKGVLIEPSDKKFERRAVLNPAVVKEGEITHLFYRAINDQGISSLGYCKIQRDVVIYRSAAPVIFPEFSYEISGIEDPRMVKIGDEFVILYTVFDGQNALIAVATSDDLIHFKKFGVISPRISHQYLDEYCSLQFQNGKYTSVCDYNLLLPKGRKYLFDKDAVLFPEKINGKYLLLHRIMPDIQYAFFDSFEDLNDEYWSNYLTNLHDYVLLDRQFEHESHIIGGGCPPIKTEEGWLLIYHAVQRFSDGKKRYTACAALLDLENPTEVIYRLPFPLFAPTEDFEKFGEVNNVVFPSGAVIEGEYVSIYYGAADRFIALKKVHLQDLLNELKLYPAKSPSFIMKQTQLLTA